eukprot:XP_002935682.1 PREDICTED: N-acetyltransferase 6 [Xenopus tropicalis]
MGEQSGLREASALSLALVPLHTCPKLIPSCAELLNETWQRSLGARMHSLERSCDDFPVCLALISSPDGPALGHVRLCKVIGSHDSLFVESVVVSTELRGKGYGRKLMEATEKYARSRGFRNLHLTTHDKQDFYHHLGYQLSEPIQSMGTLGTLLPMGILQRLSKVREEPTPSHIAALHPTDSVLSAAGAFPVSTSVSLSTEDCSAPPPLPSSSDSSSTPPPPPLPSLPSLMNLPSTTPPPPPPPPPPSLHFLSAPSPPSPSSVHLISAPPPPPLPPSSFVPPPLASVVTTPFSSFANLTLSPSPAPPYPSHPVPAQPQSPLPLSNQTGILSALQTPYRDFRGQPIFWMKKSI